MLESMKDLLGNRMDLSANNWVRLENNQGRLVNSWVMLVSSSEMLANTGVTSGCVHRPGWWANNLVNWAKACLAI